MNRFIAVSIIMPVYQVELYVERAIESVLAQTLQEKELILVDDGSTDASGQICDRYALAYPDIIQVIHQDNQGLGLARNRGVAAARGEYIAFIDSDDTVDETMYRTLYEKAREGDYDIVMCDVEIHYTQENRSAISACYPSEALDFSEYLKSGNNLTYSVNKLFKRSLWERHRYEKMVFEDIALIPALLSQYPHTAYVPRAFYHYYRRPGTLSTSVTPAMGDIVQAYRLLLTRVSPAYQEEITYQAAKQINWNVHQARPVFKADFMVLLQEMKQRFLLNPFIAQDASLKPLLALIDQPVIPERFVLADFNEIAPPAWLSALQQEFPYAELVTLTEDTYAESTLPACVRRALCEGNLSFAEEYVTLLALEEGGGIALTLDARPRLPLKQLRLSGAFFGFEDDESLTTICFGALPHHYIVKGLLDTYQTENIFNTALLPLADRLRDFLIVHCGLRPTGRAQTLSGNVRVYLPSVLAYDLGDGENCCKHDTLTPEGYQLVSDRVLAFWSARLMENWNLYKKALQDTRKAAAGAPPEEPTPRAAVSPSPAVLDEAIRDVVNRYESSTCWKITRPLRALARLFGKQKE